MWICVGKGKKSFDADLHGKINNKTLKKILDTDKNSKTFDTDLRG